MLCQMPSSDPIYSVANSGYLPSFNRLEILISSNGHEWLGGYCTCLLDKCVQSGAIPGGANRKKSE
jgi:hypothetical protein